jgi:uncharacterized protein (DUF983 family)
MIGKGSKLYSIFRFKCPHCHEGDFFVARHPYQLAKAGDVHATCPACGRKLTPEPGFYYGGMYVSYALAVALFVSIYVATLVLAPEAPLWVPVFLITVGLVALGPWLYALSKIIWANLFMSYKGIPRAEAEAQSSSMGSVAKKIT